MDVDSDLDGKLLQQFSAMGTTDREVLIAEFQKFLGNSMNRDSCAFFLDMNNWNLQAAICSYYDIEQPQVELPSMTIVDDLTVGRGEAVAPSTRFTKTWRIKNSGRDRWPPGCSLRCQAGDNMGYSGWQMVEALSPGECLNLSLPLISPPSPGVYQGQWRLSTPTGHFFGEAVWVVLTVEDNGLLGLTQQMSRIRGDLSHPQQERICEDPCFRASSQMALVPFTSTPVINPFTGQEMARVPQQQEQSINPDSRWLMQNTTETNNQGDHSVDTEMS